MLKWLTGLLTGGGPVGAGVNVIGAAAVLVPLGAWFIGAKDEVVTTITYGDLAVWGLVLFVILQVAHRAPPPGQ